jgi:hypothetical protein
VIALASVAVYGASLGSKRGDAAHQDPAPGQPAPAAPAAREDAKGSTPFELLASNHMVVRAKINGKGPFRLLFDVGSPITLLGTKAAESTGIIKPGRSKFMLFSQPGDESVETLEIGGLKESSASPSSPATRRRSTTRPRR